MLRAQCCGDTYVVDEDQPVFLYATACRQCRGGLVWSRVSDPDFKEQFREWASENHVKPLIDRRSPRYMPPLVPEAITESLKAEATKAFGRALDARLRWEYYEEWRRYDAMVEQMPPHQQALERLGECLELDRIHSLPSP